MITGADVIAFRTRRNMSRKALADACGLTEGKVWRIEKKNVIGPDEMDVLETLGVIAVTMPDLNAPAAIATVTPGNFVIGVADTASGDTDEFIEVTLS